MSNRFGNIAIGVVAICAMAMTAATVKREFFPQSQLGVGLGPSPKSQVIPNWTKFLVAGHRLGPVDAKVTILEFGDFECPACGRFERNALLPIRAAYPTQVAVIFRNWPLPYHKFALPSARAAECAATQGRYEQIHDLFYRKQDSLGLKSFTDYAKDAGVRDLAAFAQCFTRHDADVVIAADTAAARQIGGNGTPTIVINGTRLGLVPDSVKLDRLVRDALKK